MLVQEIYNKHLIPISEETTVSEALSLLIKNHFNAVFVLDKKQNLCGILCIQDIVAQIVPSEMKENISLTQAMYKPHFFHEMCQSVKDKKVKTIMRKEFFKVTLDTTLMTVAAEFLNTDLYVFPVMDKDALVGIVTRSEIKKALALAMGITP